MRIGSLFSGIGGLDWACEAAFGGETVWQLDQVNAAVRARHWPNALQITADVATVDPRSLPAIDVLCGGFACQDLSDAGKGASKVDLLAGSRTGPTYAGMLRFVEALRPEFVVLENVPALLNHRRRIEADLRGYGLTWVLCSASDVGAPHRRRRVFVVGRRGGAHGGLIEAPILRDPSWGEWPTPTLCGNDNVKGASPTSGDGLATAVRPWGTPRVGGHGSGGEREDDHGRLEDQAVMHSGLAWPTPIARDYKVGGGGLNAVGTEPLSEVAAPTGGLGRRLNPAWVEVLMGFPVGWTSPEGEGLQVDPSPRWPRGRYPADWDRSQIWPGYDWEPSRTIPDGPPCPGRPARIRGLGNAVLPQQGAHAITTALRPAQVGLFGAA